MWKRFLAFLRLSKRAVCEMSTDDRDYHDYPDASGAWEGWPVHGFLYHCQRCGRGFTI